ncbi:MAG TPA: DUF167 domain-containing protein [Candidatus Eremiobacteraceae bacterium]|nr:DUF167 domain-containing protein [Candidatus Eremiobacteraceae bacterium]
MVKPGAKAPGVVVAVDGGIVIRVRERAVEGKANDAVRRAIARAVGVPPSAVALVRGATGRRKLFRIEGLTTAEARALLGA